MLSNKWHIDAVLFKLKIIHSWSKRVSINRPCWNTEILSATTWIIFRIFLWITDIQFRIWYSEDKHFHIRTHAPSYFHIRTHELYFLPHPYACIVFTTTFVRMNCTYYHIRMHAIYLLPHSYTCIVLISTFVCMHCIYFHIRMHA